MKYLRNWDNKTWLSSKEYIISFHKYLKSKIKINKSTKILDIGCGRANIISHLNSKYKFLRKPIGIDIIKSKDIKKDILFKKSDAIKYLKNSKEVFDLILIKQTIHFFNKKEVKILLNLAKKHLSKKGKIFIFSLITTKNELPTFKKMKEQLNKSLEIDKNLVGEIKANFKKYQQNCFKFKVKIAKRDYLKMLKKRYISCLLKFTNKDIKIGIKELNLKYKKDIQFYDKLNCLIYRN